MEKAQLSTLKEKPHGTKSFPCAVYQTRAFGKGIMVKHHWHDEVEALYFSGGDFHLEINMEQFPITGECLYFINPGELHSIVAEKAGVSSEDAVVFDPAILSFESYDTAQVELIRPIQEHELVFPRCIPANHPAFPALLQCFQDVTHFFGPRQDLGEFPANSCLGASTDNLTKQLYIKSALLRMLAILTHHELFTSTVRNYDKRVEAIKTTLSYIKENYHDKIYVKDLAELLNMNEQYFCRFFKKAIGRSPMEYVNDYRIKQAIHKLKETSLSITDICLECGYNNLGNFLREFKKCTGTTPLQYRKHFLAETSGTSPDIV